jgi:hypothetical protein
MATRVPGSISPRSRSRETCCAPSRNARPSARAPHRPPCERFRSRLLLQLLPPLLLLPRRLRPNRRLSLQPRLPPRRLPLPRHPALRLPSPPRLLRPLQLPLNRLALRARLRPPRLRSRRHSRALRSPRSQGRLQVRSAPACPRRKPRRCPPPGASFLSRARRRRSSRSRPSPRARPPDRSLLGRHWAPLPPRAPLLPRLLPRLR